MIVISSREFREHQKSYFDKIDEGMEVLIQRGRNRSYKVVLVKDDDTLMSQDEFNAIIDRGLSDIQSGAGKKYTMDELRIKMNL